MDHLPTMLAAFHGAGKYKAQIAREAGIDIVTLRNYMRGAFIVPPHRRKKLDLVFGAPIDWQAYEAEFAAAKAAKITNQPPAPAPAPAPKAPEAPKKPAKAPQAPIRATPTPKAQRPSVPQEKPPVRRFFGIPIIDDSNEATA